MGWDWLIHGDTPTQVYQVTGEDLIHTRAAIRPAALTQPAAHGLVPRANRREFAQLFQQIRRFAIRTARLVSAPDQGLKFRLATLTLILEQRHSHSPIVHSLLLPSYANDPSIQE